MTIDLTLVVVALTGPAGIVLGWVLNGVAEQRRWKRDDEQRWLVTKRDVYARFLQAFERERQAEWFGERGEPPTLVMARILEEIALVAPSEVHGAAGDLTMVSLRRAGARTGPHAGQHDPVPDEDVTSAYYQFLDAARRDLGMCSLDRSRVRASH